MQAEVRHRMKNGVSFQGNYTFSKLLTDSIATAQTRIDAYLDKARPRIDRGRSEFDIKHGINTNFAYELPFGRGKMLLNNANGLVNRCRRRMADFGDHEVAEWFARLDHFGSRHLQPCHPRHRNGREQLVVHR
jgi:hypothetical protein